MEKINFVNDTTPALNATNLNKMQDNVEDVTGDLSDLETTANNNLVEAINEAKRSGGDAVPIYSIFDYDGDTAPTGYEQVDSYSETEVKTGDTWIDGRPIYRKVIKYHNNSTIGATGTATNIQIAHNISNFDMLIKPASLIHKGYSTMMGGGSSVTSMVAITYIGAENVTMTIVNDTWSSADWYITLEYIKTTD